MEKKKVPKHQGEPTVTTVTGSEAAPTQQLPDDQQKTQSSNEQPSQQEPTPQLTPQLQPRPDNVTRAQEADASERAETHKKHKAEATVLKDQGNQAFHQGDYTRAVELYTQGLERLKDFVVLYTNRAQAYNKLEKFTEAMEDCRTALQLEPNNVKALLQLGKAQHGLKDYEVAVTTYKEITKIDKKHEKVVADNVMRAQEADASERAETHKKRKAEATVLKDQGNQAFKKSDYTRAVELYTQGLERLKDFVVLYTNRAQAYNKLEKFTEAMEDCRTALQLEPNNVKALLQLGKAQHGLKDYEVAVTTYKEILNIDKKHEKVVADNVMRAQEADASERAERHKKHKAEATVLKDQGNQAFHQGNYTRAVELYTQGLERLKDFVVLYTNRAQAYNKLEKFTEAMEDCRTALQLEPNNVKALLHLGKAQHGLKDYEAAVTTYREITKIDKKYEKMVADNVKRALEADTNELGEQRKAEAMVLKDQGNQAFHEGDFTRAVELYTQGLERVKDFVVLYTNRAQAYNKLEKFTEAMEDCWTALQLEPNNVKALLHLGKAQQGLKYYLAAVKTYKEITKIDKKYEKMVADNVKRALEADANELREKCKAEATVLKDMGNQAFHQGNYTRAVVLYTQGLGLSKDFVVLYTNRAEAYNELEKFTEAMEDCWTALQLEPNNLKALLHLSKAQHGLKDYWAAFTTLQEYLKIDKKHDKMVADVFKRTLEEVANERREKRKATVLKDQGNQAFHQGDYTRAVELYTQGLEHLKDFVVLYTNRAEAYNKLEKFTEAMEDCRTALQLEPNNVKALVHLGKAQQGLKDYEAAVMTFQEILKIDKKHENMVADYIVDVYLAESTPKLDMEAERLFNEGDVKATGAHEIGLSDVTDSQAALTQQQPDDQQKTESSNEQPSQQESMPQPPLQLQPRPNNPQINGASIGNTGTISGSQNPIIVGSSAVHITYNKPSKERETTGHQGAVTFEYLQQQIIDYYKRTATTIPAHPILQSRNVDIDKFFIPLLLKKNIPGERKSKRSVRLPGGKRLLDINQTTRLHSLDDLLNPEVVKEIKILLYGGAGTGKSTLLVKVANSCVTLSSKPLLARFDLVLWIKLRQMQQSSCVLDAIFDQILARNTKLTKHIVKGFIDDHESRIALLLDGLDEIPSHVLQSEEGVYRVKDILRNKVLAKSFVLVTTRPHMTEYVLSDDHQYAVVETVGFTPQDRDQYIRLNLRDDADMGDKLISNLKVNANLQEMAVVPIISQMLCIVWENQKSLPERITELYADFALALFKRRNKDMSGKQVMSNMMSIIDGLGCVALQGLLDSRGERLMFDETEFQDCQSCLDEGCRVGFVQLETYTSGLRVHVLVTFPHKSIQEYFAACHLVKLLQDDENNFRHQMEQIGEHNVHGMEYLLRFCCGTSRQAAGLILDHIEKMKDYKMLDYEKKLQRLARLFVFESCSEELATKLVRPIQVHCKSNEDLKSLNYYLQHVIPPLEGTNFYMDVRQQELTYLKGILLSDSMESAHTVNVNYRLSEQQEEEELSFLEKTLGVVDEQHSARLDVTIEIDSKSWFDLGLVSHSFFRMQELTGSLSLFMVQRSPDEAVDLLNVLEGCRLRWLTVGDIDLHARIRDVSHIPSSLISLNLSGCGLVDDDVKDLMRILPAGHGLHILVLDYNAFSSNAVSDLTHHLRSLPNVGWLPLADERGGVRRSRGLTMSIGGPLSFGTRPFMF